MRRPAEAGSVMAAIVTVEGPQRELSDTQQGPHGTLARRHNPDSGDDNG